MEPRYVYILDFTISTLNIIRLTDEELKESESFDDFGDFLTTLEDKYGFRLSNCQWMTSQDLDVYYFENGKEAHHTQCI